MAARQPVLGTALSTALKAVEYRRDGDRLFALLDAKPGSAPSFSFRRVDCDVLFSPR